MESIVKQQINRAVEIICKDIQEQTTELNWIELSEESILFELVLSILGSQNKYEVALKFANVIKEENILTNYTSINDIKRLEDKLEEIFTTPQNVENSMVKYRFPKTRAKYIAYSLFFLEDSGGIKKILKNSKSTLDIRKFIVKNIKGMGPKQASHFLRNIGFSNNIAVLDVHILRYMNIQGVISEEYKSTSSLKVYEYLELKLIKFLEFILAPIGFIDQAIWIVMRVYQREYATCQ